MESGTAAERYSRWTDTVVAGIARATAVLAAPAVAWVVRDAIQLELRGIAWLALSFAVSTFLCAFFRVGVAARTHWLLINQLTFLWLGTPLGGVTGGFGGLTLLIAVESALLLKRNQAWLYIALAIGGLLVGPLLVVAAGFPRPIVAFSDMGTPANAIRASFMIGTISVLALITVSYLNRKLKNTMFYSEQLIFELRGQIAARELGERRRLQAEQELIRAQKLEMLGQVAGSVAHDVNNNLTVTLACVEVLERQHADPQTQKLYDSIRHAVDNATNLTRQLLTLGRRNLPRHDVVRVEQVLERLRALLPTAVGRQIELSIAIDEDIPPVYVDGAQIEQVLLNLIINARDAMPNGGLLRIRVTTQPASQSYRVTTANAAPQHAVRISVSDTGDGIADEILPNIMEPFFTTKRAGQGTGLGLAVARAFAEESRGRLCVDTAVGRGTTFTLELPAADAAMRFAQPMPKQDGRESASAVVLIAEDDPRIRETMALELERQGHSVLLASNGLEALERAKQAPHIDLLCTDLSMPPLGGEKLLRLFRELHSGARVLVCSAYAHEPALREFVQEGRYAVLVKPFSPAELAGAVRAVLAAAVQGPLAVS